jgi:hypothetical protein
MKSDCVNIATKTYGSIKPTLISFAPLPKAVPQPPYPVKCKVGCEIKQEGKTPMRYNETNAYASVSAPKSDIAVQREYLLARLNDAWYPKERQLEQFFNLYADNTPKTYKDMIDAIKNGKYTIDKKIEKNLETHLEDTEDDEFGGELYWGPLYGIIWDGPKIDRDGYNKAREAARVEKTKANDIIMTGDGTAGLAALQAFEAWMPTAETKAN